MPNETPAHRPISKRLFRSRNCMLLLISPNDFSRLLPLSSGNIKPGSHHPMWSRLNCKMLPTVDSNRNNHVWDQETKVHQRIGHYILSVAESDSSGCVGLNNGFHSLTTSGSSQNGVSDHKRKAQRHVTSAWPNKLTCSPWGLRCNIGLV
jgi:hypothetical protein